MKSKLIYDYDFGDRWEHDVVVEHVDAASPAEMPPVCTDGGRACPPEDCGGPWGYGNLLEALADSKHPEHAELSEWVSPHWLPDDFNSDLVNKELHALSVRWRRPMAPRDRALAVRCDPATIDDVQRRTVTRRRAVAGACLAPEGLPRARAGALGPRSCACPGAPGRPARSGIRARDSHDRVARTNAESDWIDAASGEGETAAA